MTLVRLRLTFCTRFSVRQHPKSVILGGALAMRPPQLKVGGIIDRPLMKYGGALLPRDVRIWEEWNRGSMILASGNSIGKLPRPMLFLLLAASIGVVAI